MLPFGSETCTGCRPPGGYREAPVFPAPSLNPPPRAPRSRRRPSWKKPRTITRHVARTCLSSPAFRLGEVRASNARDAREAPGASPTRRCTSFLQGKALDRRREARSAAELGHIWFASVVERNRLRGRCFRSASPRERCQSRPTWQPPAPGEQGTGIPNCVVVLAPRPRRFDSP